VYDLSYIGAINNSGVITATGGSSTAWGIGSANALRFTGSGYAAAGAAGAVQAGDKIILFDDTTHKYAIGIDAGYFWFQAGAGGNGFRWYQGTTQTMLLDGSGNLSPQGYVQYTGSYNAGNYYLLNKAGSGWLAFATRDTAGSESVFDLAYVGTVGCGAITSTGIVQGTSHVSTSATVASVFEAGCATAGSQPAYAQIRFGYNGTSQYAQFITSQHYGGQAASNAIGFWTSDGTQNGTFPTNAVFGMWIENGSVRIGGTGVSGSTMPSPTATLQVVGNCVISTGFGCNSKTPQTAYASGGALASYIAGSSGLSSGTNMQALVNLANSIRTALVNNGIMS
jgi:hypothetical protein